MEDKFVRELKLLLKRLQEEDSFLKVKWETGGDEQFINFDVYGKEEVLQDEYSDMLDELRMLLIDKFDLPNRSEYMNIGAAKFFISDENQLMIKYEVYEYQDGVTSENLISSTLSFLNTLEMKSFLAKAKMKTCKFHAYVDYQNYIGRMLEIFGYQSFDEYQRLIDKIVLQIETNLQPYLPVELKDLIITYSGSIDQKKFYITELSISRYKVFKDKRDSIEVLIS